MSRWRVWAPLAGFAIVLAVIAAGLFRPADRTVRSRLIGQPLPALTLPPAISGVPGIALGNGPAPRLVNIFASWCVPCAAEAPQLMALKSAGVRVEGIAVRDAPDDLAAFLRRNGNPYAAIGDDRASRVQLALGSSGVPETFVIGADGRIALQHVGDIRPDDLPAILAALGEPR